MAGGSAPGLYFARQMSEKSGSDNTGGAESDAYGFGTFLTAEGLFQLTTDEAFRDGKIDDEENRLLQIIGRFLKISSDTARRLARRSRDKFKNGEFNSRRGFDGRSLYRRVLGYYLASSLREQIVTEALELLKKLFKIDEDSHKAIHEEVLKRIRDARQSKRDVSLSGTLPVRSRHVSVSEALAGNPEPKPIGEGLPVEHRDLGESTEQFYVESIRWIKEAIEAKKKGKETKDGPLDLTDV